MSVCTVSHVMCVLMRTSRRTLENTSARLGSSSTPLRGFLLRFRKSKWGTLETMVPIWQPQNIDGDCVVDTSVVKKREIGRISVHVGGFVYCLMIDNV